MAFLKVSVTKKLYGSVSLESGYCSFCKESWLGRPCCEEISKDYRRVVRVSRGNGKRYFSRTAVDEALQKQNGLCFWCETNIGLGFYKTTRGSIKPLYAVGDHLVPFSYEDGTCKNNLVVSCNICNSIKSSKIFPTVEKTREFILSRRSDKQVSIKI